MAPRGRLLRAAAALAPAALLACIDKPPDPLPGTVVFRGAFTTGVTPWAFSGSKLDALSIDTYERLDGQPTVRIDVPASSATPGFSGGPFLAASPVSLSRATALTFWTRASRAATLDKVGFGLDFTSDNRFETTVFGLPLTTEWTPHRIPIADPSRMPPQLGLFWYGASSPAPYSLWFADVRFMDVTAADLDLQPSLVVSTITLAVGKKGYVPYALTYADADGTRVALDSTAAGSGPAPAFLTFDSSSASVAAVDGSGTIVGAGVGTAIVSATLAGTAPQDLTVNVVASLPTAPTAGPPNPTYAAADVISLYSGSYPTAPGVNTCAPWSSATCSTVTLGGNPALRYANLLYAGVEFVSNRIDASAMGYLHVDVWTPDATRFGVKLVSFPVPGNTTTTVEATVAFGARTIPPILASQWVSIDIPLSRFAGVPLGSIGQLVWLDDDSIGGAEHGTFFIDNVYFHK